MSAINWHNLRSWGGSQNGGFEELCCQLAAHEPAPTGAEYRRIGAPDAGVECIWQDPDGSVRAWQAKFFLQPPTAGQWGQLDKSVQQAVDHYPELKAYTVCLPLDRSDARQTNQKSMMDRWVERVDKWTKLAGKKGRQITFHYWGEHEVADRLARTEHAGRRYFWFNSHALSAQWFRDRFETAKANAGPRYSPELNVELEIGTVFDALARHPRFVERIRRQWGNARRELVRALPLIRQNRAQSVLRGDDPAGVGEPPSASSDQSDKQQARTAAAKAAAEAHITPFVDSARRALEKLAQVVAALDACPGKELPFDRLRADITDLRQVLESLDSAFQEADTIARNVNSPAARPSTGDAPGDQSSQQQLGGGETLGAGGARRREFFENERYHLWGARGTLDDLQSMCDDQSARVANVPALLVTGEAGTGKTHLLCDVTDHAVRSGAPCVLVMGEQFVRGTPWPQIMNQLDIDITTPDQFLGALSAAGEAAGQRSLLLIDGLNEGEGRDIWPKHLAGLLTTIARYPWVGLAVSVRSSYASIVVPQPAREKLTEVVHRGFAEREIDATRRFFDAYGLERPSVPLLTPEFANPLFLKLFCSGLVKSGLKRVPLGLEGITAVFDFFLDSVQKRLANPGLLDFDEHEPIVEKAVSAIATEMRTNQSQWIPRDRARAIADGILPSSGGFDRSLLRHLLNEGVVSAELVHIGAGQKHVEVVRFTYERLGDHRVAQLLLNEYLAPPILPDGDRNSVYVSDDRTSLARGDLPGSDGAPISLTLCLLLANEDLAWYNRGIIEALAIQVPERTGKELWELDGGSDEVARPIKDAFLSSLEWRRPDAIGATARSVIDQHLRADSHTGGRVRDLIVSVTARPGHPLNAEYLDDSLAHESMAERDTWWSTYVAAQADPATPLGRLIDWAWRAGSEPHHSNDAVHLASITLLWALSSPNRQVRDHATKGLVSLLHRRSEILRGLMKRFASVNDLYVLERLYAVAYGCALRGLPATDLDSLSRLIFDTAFASDAAPPHLLLRDYARGIIELAVARGMLTDLEVSRARPPYHSEPPGVAPTLAELEAEYYTPFRDGKDEGYHSLWSSLLSQGDFARYIVGTNSHSFEWTARHLYGPHPATRRAQHETFFESLQPELQEWWRRIKLSQFMATLPALVDDSNENVGHPNAAIAGSTSVSAEEASFRRALPAHLRAEFDRVRNWGNEPVVPKVFDLEYALRWLFQRVLDFGWTPQRFSAFDRHGREYEGRMSHRSERMGKKYQWIAWHEFTARVSDNFEFRNDAWSNTSEEYNGPWQLYRRDIDPSYLGRGGRGFRAARQAWWQQATYSPANDWRRIPSDTEWLATTDDLPFLAQIIAPKDPYDGTLWWWLDGDVEWREPEPPEEEVYERPRRSIRYWITTFIVRANDRKELLEWLRERDLWQLDLHDHSSTTQIFLGEYPWAPSYKTQFGANAKPGWTRLRNQLPVPIARPALPFHWESGGYDRSIEHAINLAMPAASFVERPPGSDVQVWPRARAQASFYNPSLNTDGPDALMTRSAVFRRFLNQHGLDLVWIMTGEKLVIGGGITSGNAEWGGRLELSAFGSFVDDSWKESIVAYFNRGGDDRSKVSRSHQ